MSEEQIGIKFIQGDIIRNKKPYIFEGSHRVLHNTSYGILTDCPADNHGFCDEFSHEQLQYYEIDTTSLIMIKLRRKLCKIRYKLIDAGILKVS